MTARETTTNIRSNHTEKHMWAAAALTAGYTRTVQGNTVGNVSQWLRDLANREAKRTTRRTAGGNK